MQKGKINVNTENIFPLIKKFLYSDHEVFLRELVSNAVDASQKLKTLASLRQFEGELGDLTIEIKVDKDNKTLTFSDKGIGMTAEEIDKYINQIAFSGAEEFIQKYKGKTEAESNALIGHFGLGFYSAFMVAKQVDIISLSYQKDAEAVKWSCDGSPEFSIEKAEKSNRGTDIILHIADDSIEFLEENRILDLLKKYCKFMPISILFGEEKIWEDSETEKDENEKPKRVEVTRPRIINNTNPLWKQKVTDLKDEDYLNFYRELYPYSFEEPLFHIHLNVDYPFNLTGILYFPKIKNKVEFHKDKIQLYCNQVFVTDSVEGIVPEFLTLMHGVIDSPDIPLNVSRSYLQSDANVKKISGHISKKVTDKLEEIFKNQRDEFEKKWDDLKIFIQYGMLSDPKFYERAEKFCLFKNINNEYFTFTEYKEKISPLQTNKHDNVIYLYTNDVTEQHSYILQAKEKGYDVLLMDGTLDSHFIQALEQKNKKSNFVRIDSDIIDKLIEKEDTLPSKLNDEDKEKLKPIIEDCVDKDTFTVSFESMSETDAPMTITLPEFMRRMKDMSQTGGSPMGFYGNLPDHYNLVINSNHPIIWNVFNQTDNTQQKQTLKQLTDLALLSHGLLKGEDLTNFIQRSVSIIGNPQS